MFTDKYIQITKYYNDDKYSIRLVKQIKLKIYNMINMAAKLHMSFTWPWKFGTSN